MRTQILVLLLLISGFGYAATIESNGTGGGDWADADTWEGTNVPVAGDDIIINSGDIVTILENISINGDSVHIDIYGQLRFLHKGKLKGSLTLDAGSTINLHSTTALLGDHNNNQITVGTLTQWTKSGYTNDNTAITDYTNTLPIELLEYKIKDNSLYFTTASQFDVDRFEIELYNEDFFQIGLLYADPCNCNQLMEYNIPIEDSEVRYVRLVEYDFNGDVVQFKYLAINPKVLINAFQEDVYYTMDGRMLRTTFNQLKPGVYIYKGKKIVKTNSSSY